MTPVRAIPVFALLAAAAVEPRGCSEQSARSPIVQSQVELASRRYEPGPAGSGCWFVPFQIDALYRQGVDDGLRTARVCCNQVDSQQIWIEATDPSLHLMVSEHGPLRRFMAHWCLDPSRATSDHIVAAPDGTMCAGARCARLEVR